MKYSVLHVSKKSSVQPGFVGHQLAMRLRKAYLSMHRATNNCFIEYGLSADSFTILMVLAEHTVLTQKEIVEKINSDANTVSAMLIRLEKMNLIIRKKDKDDGRVRRVKLTAKGKRTQKRLWDKSHSIRVEMENLFEHEEMMNLIQMLNRLETISYS